MRHLLIVGALAGLLSACGSAPTGPTGPPSIAGSWSGPASDTYGGRGTITFSLTQSGTNVTGYWLAVSDDASVSIGGLVVGSMNGASFRATLTPGDPLVCSYAAKGSIWGVNLNGTLSAVNCSESITVVFNLLRTE
jgi:hypothetical protein